MPLEGRPISTYVHDFVKSKDRKFRKDSRKQRIRRAIAAYYADKRRSESKRRADRHLREQNLFLEYYKDEHDAYSRHKTRQAIVGLLNQAYIKHAHGHTQLDHAIEHWLSAEIHEFGHFERMPESNLRDNWDDYCSLMTGAHEHIEG